MTRCTEVKIEGFKGIQSLNVEPTAINIITGRNNTGKTSFLEAIELSFDPGNISNFGGNIDTLVNIECETATIDTELGDNTSSIEIFEPDERRAREILIDALLQTASKFITWAEERTVADAPELNAIENDLQTIIEDSISPSAIEDIRTESAIVSVNGTEYPYLYPGGTAQVLNRNITEKIRERIAERHDGSDTTLQTTLRNIPAHLPVGLFGEGVQFVGDRPPVVNAVTAIDGRDLTEPPETENGESTAVRIDDIEDILIEHEIVDDLRSFDFDYLVFTDDEGEKYSVPYEFMGDGFKAIVGILWELLDAERTGDVLLLEEPAIHMHPGYVRELVYFLVDIARERDVQLFITTHNNDFIADFFGENITDEERSYLEAEFTLVQMQSDTADVMSYREAEEHLKDLHLDLRGI